MTERAELLKVRCLAVVLIRDAKGNVVGERDGNEAVVYSPRGFADYWKACEAEIEQHNAAQPNRAQRRRGKPKPKRGRG